ncbi:MAG: AAA family ATPase [bacterium]|nr:AAA family ATPase [bacterium]
MYLKSIELAGFKSFSKKSVLEFNSPISSIVGPNGTGKSNIAEAFRFVLGEQSIKSLRGKRGEDLIFNGGSGEARANRASVKVVFDNIEKIFSIDFPEVTLERIVHRDGVNEYLINGSSVRLKDIISLLSDAHIGSSGHHIISQGEADKILNATAKERKLIIEDALGLKVYQYKKIESERKLKKTFENIARVESLRKEIAPHIRFLKKQVEKIEKVELLQIELMKLAKEYFKRENLYLAFNKNEIDSERKPLDEKLKILSKELTEAKLILQDVSRENNKNFEVLELEKEISKVRTEKDSLLREIGKIEGMLGAEEKLIKRQKELAQSEDQRTVYLKDVEKMYQDFSNETKKAKSKEDYKAYISIVNKFLSNLSEFILEKKDSSNSNIIFEAEASLRELLISKTKLETDISKILESENLLRAKYDKYKLDIDKEKDSSRDAEKAVFRIMSEENEIISRLNLIHLKEEKIKQEEITFMNEVEEMSHILGPSVLHFKDISIGDEANILKENRTLQTERNNALLRIKIRLEDSGVSGFEDVAKEYKEANERDEFLAKELFDLAKSSLTLRELIKDLEERLAVEFSSGVEKINKEFSGLFSLMFGGGEAKITAVKEKKKKIDAILEGLSEDEMDETEEEEITEEGLDINLNLPRKKIKGLMMLSGGERALTSIALLFAISAVNPPPFIILDETDAALDEANSKKYGDMVEKLSTHSQLILITHNRETMSRAGIIYGVTMTSTGISKLLSIQFDEAVQVAK